jgi:hypothetical protein
MSRRHLLLALSVTTGLLTAGVASAATGATGCASYTDATGDGVPVGTSTMGLPNDADVDLSAVSFTTNAGALVAQVKVAGLTEYGGSSHLGDKFEVHGTLLGKPLYLAVFRNTSTGSPTLLFRGTLGEKEAMPTAATFDVKTSTVTISTPIATLNKAAGRPVTGQPISEQFTESRVSYLYGEYVYDNATATPTAAYRIGKTCALA